MCKVAGSGRNGGGELRNIVQYFVIEKARLEAEGVREAGIEGVGGGMHA